MSIFKFMGERMRNLKVIVVCLFALGMCGCMAVIVDKPMPAGMGTCPPTAKARTVCIDSVSYSGGMDIYSEQFLMILIREFSGAGFTVTLDREHADALVRAQVIPITKEEGEIFSFSLPLRRDIKIVEEGIQAQVTYIVGRCRLQSMYQELGSRDKLSLYGKLARAIVKDFESIGSK